MQSISSTPLSVISAESIENLLREYNLPLQVPSSKFKLSQSHIGLLRIGMKRKPDNAVIQAAKLALLMESCESGKLQFNCTISNPKEGEIKGTQKKIEIESEFFNFHFTRFLHTFVSQVGGGHYEYNLLSSEPEDYKSSYNIGCFGFTEDWSEDELNAIIEYEESKASRCLNEYTLIGQRLKFILSKLTDYNLFKGWTKTKIYSFLYDWGVLQGIFNDMGQGFSGEIGRDKFTEINNRIKAYEKKAGELGRMV